MANIVNFTTDELDYDSLVSALRTYMSYQTEFKDYNFEGSALSSLIHLLAYNTHYNGLYDNFALNESFLDSAFKRSSVISHAGLLNYIPRSAHAAEAIINFTVYDDQFDSTAASITLPKYSVFTSSVDGVDYTFYTDGSNELYRNGSNFVGENIKLRQGTFITLQRVYQGDSSQKFILNSVNVDTDTISVQVVHNQELYTFTKADNILNNNSDSKVYFLTMNNRGLYQIEFGSGMLGYSLSAGDIIYITYLSCSEDPTACNGAYQFTYKGNLLNLGFSNTASEHIATVQRATGGRQVESTESIRTLAPKIFASQNRCVTAEDYKAMIQKHFDNIDAINVWGGQDNDPPEYGKVFVSIIPKDERTLTTVEKNQILAVLENKKELTKLIEFVDPEYIDVNISSTVYYNSENTALTESDLNTAVRNTIINFGANHLDDFGDVLRFSQLSQAIDNTDSCITNNTTRIRLTYDVQTITGAPYSYTINTHNEIYRNVSPSECVLSSGFTCSDYGDTICFIDDDPTSGKLRLFKLNDNNEKIILKNNVGTVDYQSGIITVDSLEVTGLADYNWTFDVNPSSYDVISSRYQFAKINKDNLVVTLVDQASKKKYQQTTIK